MRYFSLMRMLQLALILALAACGAAGANTAFTLITQQEYEANANIEPPLTKALQPIDPNAPVIELISPELAATIPAPVDIDLRFKPKPGTEILPQTFHAFYGWLKLDITDRILKQANVTATGIKVANADLPNGKHQILIQIEDSKGRVGKKEISFRISK